MDGFTEAFLVFFGLETDGGKNCNLAKSSNYLPNPNKTNYLAAWDSDIFIE